MPTHGTMKNIVNHITASNNMSSLGIMFSLGMIRIEEKKAIMNIEIFHPFLALLFDVLFQSHLNDEKPITNENIVIITSILFKSVKCCICWKEYTARPCV